MQVSSVNGVKIYNLSSGRSLPEWLTDQKKRSLQQRDEGIRRRIELIQDFEMPTVSEVIKVSPDGQYILAAGTYKPTFRCYDVTQLSMKFERCLDSDIVTMKILSEDYSKLVFLQCDRYVEFHSQQGHWYRTRLPKFGRDLSYHSASCDLYFVGSGPEVFRLNLEQGCFLNSLVTNASSNNCCDINPVHNLFACGTAEGRVECWDPRTRGRVGLVDCALSSFTAEAEVLGLPAVSTLKFKDALQMVVGTTTGQILLYDLRSKKPLIVKDHRFGLPIHSVFFHEEEDLIISADSRIVKMWNKQTGKLFSSLEPECNINDLCVYPNSGMLFLACEAPKMNTYYIPALGPAPRWCSFLDSLTEELEETPESTVYDDYKFVTCKDLDNLGLNHLVGSPLLRAYMHGFFMDIRLYNKVKSMANTFAFEKYRKQKVREKIEAKRVRRVKIEKLPTVNRDLAERLREEAKEDGRSLGRKRKSAKKMAPELLTDLRFQALFENPDYQVDEESEEFRLLNPIVSQTVEKCRKRRREVLAKEELEVEDSELEGLPSEEEESSDDDQAWSEEVRQQARLLKMRARNKGALKKEDAKGAVAAGKGSTKMKTFGESAAEVQPRFYELKRGVEFQGFQNVSQKTKNLRMNLEERVKLAQSSEMCHGPESTMGSKQLTFQLQTARKQNNSKKLQQQQLDRKRIRRSAKNLPASS
uniref:Nucleolar protein 10 n=1 Tax=Eptatretus burgeri TaxID=7764 RepID=A0A8C4R3T4_EPTBU